ncbi:ABC transporter substrate-binding protein [Deinococcus yavapaiensis]|uniref:Peptide/nickel transport system substrate-binding protein n=1 Tax=Deinococcus yavapaiensis KR-236 TaxID=694435 RepID=A0A318S3P7_9DEIO|nr:ABC transporter substrate-binding protein [Deinococcus yavapaiensis]PYE52065.1 peptide/nickel transport system substrate-binding protein [Deinococcus yavapaiensis KR-236]
MSSANSSLLLTNDLCLGREHESQRHFTKAFARSCSVLLVLAGFTLPSQVGAATLVYGSGGEPFNLEGGNVSDGNSVIVHRQIYDYLVGLKPGGVDLVPALATSWNSNNAATVWTFTLRRDVKFHDGTAVNADAILFNFNRWWDPKDQYGFRNQGRTYESFGEQFGGFKGERNSLVKSAEKVNDYTIRFTLTQAVPAFPNLLAQGYFGIASPKAIRDQGAKYGTPAGVAVGSGPFKFESWRAGDRVVLSANKTYWGAKPKVDELVFRFIREPSARLNELKAGTIDFTVDLAPDNLAAVRADKNLRAVLKPSFNVGFLSLNVRNENLKNAKVREAISMAINRDALVKSFYGELGSTSTSLLPEALSWANSSKVPEKYPFDRERAKRLLADAGYPNGFSLDLWYMPVSRPYFPMPKPIAEAMAADLSAIGIKVNLKTKDWAQYLVDRNQAPGFDMYMIGWTGNYGDPDDFYSAYYGSANATADTGFNPTNIAQLLDRARLATTQADKAKLYAQVHERTYEAYVRLVLVHSRPLAAARTYVKGWVPSLLGSEPFNTISVEGKR